MKKKELFKNYTLFILLGVFFAVVVYQIVMKHMLIEGCDYSNAGIRALTIFSDKDNGGRMYPIWPVGVKVFYRFFKCCLYRSAAYTTMIMYVLRFVISYILLRYYIGERYSGNVCAALAAVSMIVQHISVVGLKNEVTWGIAHVNTWHNPTNPVAILFGICSLFCVFRLFEEWEQNSKISGKWLVLFGLVNVLADLGKPSFAQVFIPAIAIYCVCYCIKSKFKSFKFCLAIAIALIPSVIILMMQSGSFFNFSNLTAMEQNQRILLASAEPVRLQVQSALASDVIIDWFEVMQSSWGNIPLTLIGTLAFPAYTAIVYFKETIKDKKVILAWLMGLIGFLEYAAFSQEGAAKYHGNFGWGYILSMAILFLISIMHFMKSREKGWNVKTVIGVILLAMHFICGWNYMCWQIMEEGFWF